MMVLLTCFALGGWECVPESEGRCPCLDQYTCCQGSCVPADEPCSSSDGGADGSFSRVDAHLFFDATLPAFFDATLPAGQPDSGTSPFGEIAVQTCDERTLVIESTPGLEVSVEPYVMASDCAFGQTPPGVPSFVQNEPEVRKAVLDTSSLQLTSCEQQKWDDQVVATAVFGISIALERPSTLFISSDQSPEVLLPGESAVLYRQTRFYRRTARVFYRDQPDVLRGTIELVYPQWDARVVKQVGDCPPYPPAPTATNPPS